MMGGKQRHGGFFSLRTERNAFQRKYDLKDYVLVMRRLLEP